MDSRANSEQAYSVDEYIYQDTGRKQVYVWYEEKS